jgi:hypothetical protein
MIALFDKFGVQSENVALNGIYSELLQDFYTT